jgi:hypothetical protein
MFYFKVKTYVFLFRKKQQLSFWNKVGHGKKTQLFILDFLKLK